MNAANVDAIVACRTYALTSSAPTDVPVPVGVERAPVAIHAGRTGRCGGGAVSLVDADGNVMRSQERFFLLTWLALGLALEGVGVAREGALAEDESTRVIRERCSLSAGL